MKLSGCSRCGRYSQTLASQYESFYLMLKFTVRTLSFKSLASVSFFFLLDINAFIQQGVN